MKELFVVLASGSPRRRELLDMAGIKYEGCPSGALSLIPWDKVASAAQEI